MPLSDIVVFFPSRPGIPWMQEGQEHDPALCAENQEDRAMLATFAALVRSQGGELDTSQISFTCIKYIDPKHDPYAVSPALNDLFILT